MKKTLVALGGALILVYGGLALGQSEIIQNALVSLGLSGPAPQLTCTSTTDSCQINSDITAASATSSVPVFSLRPSVTLDANDRILSIRNGAGTQLWYVDNEGDTVTSGTYSSSSATGPQFSCGSSTGTCQIDGALNAATMSTTVAAITMKQTVTPDNNDLVLQVFKSDDTSLLKLDEDGDLTVPGSITVATGVGSVLNASLSLASGTVTANAAGVQMTFRGAQNDSATAIATKVTSGVTMATAGSKIMSWYPDDGTTEQAFIDKDGSLRINANGGAGKPACAVAYRGRLWYVAGAGGVLDTYEVCRKDAADAYAWVSVY